MPSLRHLDLRKSEGRGNSPIALRLPTSLSSLSLKARHPIAGDRLFIDSSGCAALTSLSVRFITDANAIAALIEATAGTLCTLNLALDGRASQELVARLDTERLTSLTSLHLANDTAIFVDAIFSKRRTQIRHLKLINDRHLSSVDVPLFTEVCENPIPRAYPSLTHLELLGSGWEMAEAILAELARRAPRLHTLTMGEVVAPQSRALLKLAAPLLTTLSPPWSSYESFALSPSHLTEALTRLTSIHRLHLGADSPARNDMLAFIASSQRHALMIRSVHIQDGAPEALRAALLHCTWLRKLQINRVTEETLAAFPLPPSTALPYLRKLSLVGRACALPSTCGLMAHLIAACPNLTRLKLPRTQQPDHAFESAISSACPTLAIIRAKDL